MSYPLAYEFTGLFRRAKIESLGKFRTADTAVPAPIFRAHDRAQGNVVCTNVALATGRRMFVLSPTGSQVADIFVKCPRTGTPISTGLRTEWVLVKSLPRVPIPVRCPACGQMHKWDSQDAWTGPMLESRVPTRLSGSRAASWSASASNDEKTQELD